MFIMLKLRNNILLLTLLSFLFVISEGCTSLNESVIRLSARGRYREALAQLEKKGVGAIPLANAKPKDLEARLSYENAVNSEYNRLVQSEIAKGNARKALRFAEEGQELCFWSKEIMQMVVSCRQIVEKIDRTIEDWDCLVKGPREPPTSSEIKTFLLRAEVISNLAADSPRAQVILQESRALFAKFLEEDLRRQIKQKDAIGLHKLTSDLHLIKISNTYALKVIEVAKNLIALPWSEGEIDSLSGSLSEKQSQCLQNIITIANSVSPTATKVELVAGFYNTLKTTFEDWVNGPFTRLLNGPDPSLKTINEGEEFISLPGLMLTTNFKNSLALAHSKRAALYAPRGKAAVLALLHLKRAKELSSFFTPSSIIESIGNTANASLFSSGPMQPSITIDISPEIDPEVNQLIQLSLFMTLSGRTAKHCRWQWVDPVYGNPVVRIKIRSAHLHIASLRDLPLRTSNYLSHYEDVPNPEKSRLKLLLNVAEFDLDMKLSSYNSAVSSHNIYPTKWSLQNVNFAYNNYNMAVNYYNSLVSIYNLTPSTISKPVYLPYFFREGKIKQGWSLKGTVITGPHSKEISAEAIDEDFVRFDTRYNDINPETRRDNKIDIDIGINRLIDQLIKISGEICDQIGTVLFELPTMGVSTSLSSEERITISWILHPFGSSKVAATKAELPPWVYRIVGSIKLPEIDVKPPVIFLSPQTKTTFNLPAAPSTISKAYQSYVCEVISGVRGAENKGSGALVSGDGLILTCAHVLQGSVFKVRFNEGPLRGIYDAEPVFVNETMDVALLRVNRLASRFWIPIRLDRETSKGEELVAIGNPVLPDGTPIKGAISNGIVSSPGTEYFGAPRLIADITVASGSSGGPLISSETGEIVGVVVAVVPAGIDEEGVSSSGFFCIAAPSHLLGKWLGISYTPKRGS
jgi:hypothetical protein